MSVQRRKGTHEKSGHTISFYQGAGRNLGLCEKLERLLTKFGFEWSYTEDERKSNKDAPCYGYRTYRLKSDGLPMLQRFLHVVQPAKWRDRIVSAAYLANFIKGRERVVSIVPAGRTTVYGLTTTTGNYVVWGLASSNSAGQLQQRPEPKGGGIIKREWWQPWDDVAFPPMDFVLASLDTAYTTKQENDFSALTIWGVFSGDVVAQATKTLRNDGGVIDVETTRSYSQQHGRVMLMNAWQEKLELHDLVAKIAQTCKAMKVDKLIIEDKAAGHSVAQELRRLFGYEQFTVQLINPGAFDKMARLYSVQHLFADGLIYAPDRSWSDAVITQCGTFPKSRHDDLVDTVSMGLKHLRDMGLIIRGSEHTAEMQANMRVPGKPPGPLYGI